MHYTCNSISRIRSIHGPEFLLSLHHLSAVHLLVHSEFVTGKRSCRVSQDDSLRNSSIVLAVMASQLLRSVSFTGAVSAPLNRVANIFPEAGREFEVARVDRHEFAGASRVQECGISYLGCRLGGNQWSLARLLDGPASCSTSCEKHRRKKMQSRGSLNNDDGNGEGRSSGHIRERSGAGGTAAESLYVKRNIDGGEIVEHTGSIVILGDVKQGGYVSAGGDVIVLGRLQGTVQAGKYESHSAIVFVAVQDSGTINIGTGATLQLPKNGSSAPHVATLAPNGRILILPTTEEASHEQKFNPEKLRSLGEFSYETVEAVKAGFKDSATLSMETQNKRPAQVALFTGIYILVAGLVLFAFPNLFGILFDLQSVSPGWIQVGAVLAVVFGVYYIGTAVGDLRGLPGAQAFYYSTVVGRTFLFSSFAWLVIAGAVPSALLLVGLVNLVGAGAMLRALSERRNQVGYR